MPIYQYRAIDQAGQRQTGSVTNVSREAAAKELARRGWIVQEVSATPVAGDPIPSDFGRAPAAPPPVHGAGHAAGAATGAVNAPTPDHAPPQAKRDAFTRYVIGPIFRKAPLPAVAFALRQLAAMLNAGVNPVQAIETLTGQVAHPRLRPPLLAMREMAASNEPMSRAMRQYPEVFSPLICNLMVAGEKGGFLVESLRSSADYLEREIALRNMIRRATFYPKLLLVVALCIIGAANTIAGMIVPGGQGVFNSPLNQIVTWMWLGPTIVGTWVCFRIGLAYEPTRYIWDTFVSKLPYLGTTVRQFAMAKFGRALGALYRGGVSIPDAMVLAAFSCGNQYLARRMAPAFSHLQGGASLGETLAQTGAFNPVVLSMIRTGEATGNLDEMLNNMAQYYEDEASVRATQMGHVFAVLVLLAVIVYLIVIAVQAISPVLGMYQQMGNEVSQ